jgi:serine/threonine protein phosphatase PrpC
MIRTERAHLNVAARTHPGMTGKQNEDRFAVTAYQVGPSNPTPSLFAVVADGIGGHKAGELAAELAVNVISHTVSQSDAFEPLNTLQVAIQSASQRIAAQARDNTQHLGMGTTCACAWIVGRRLYTTSVGDSRIYLLRGKTIRQLTTDHTWIQEAIDKGILKAEEAREHPNVHVIRRYLGSARPPEPDLRLRTRRGESDTEAEANQGFLLYPGDRLLLCTDGLTDEISDEEIRVAGSTPNLEFGADSLIELANSRGGHDNITVVLIEVPGKPRKKRIGLWPWILAALAGLIFLLAVAGGLTWVLKQPSTTPTPTRAHPTALSLPTVAATPTVTETNAHPTAIFSVTPRPTLTQTSTITITPAITSTPTTTSTATYIPTFALPPTATYIPTFALPSTATYIPTFALPSTPTKKP